MLRSVKEMQGYTLHATDGNIGHVEELYFDNEHWTVRYLVVNTGSWLFGRRVLISPLGIDHVDWERQAVNLNLTREQVANSPDIDTDKPVSRQQEWNYFGYFGWPIYWSGGLAWGAAMYPGLMVPPPGTTSEDPNASGGSADGAQPEEHGHDSHLHSTREVAGYRVHARDGDLGHVDDFIIDDRSWMIRYIVVDTANFWAGKRVLIPPRWLTDVSWSDSRVSVDHTREEIRNSPEWDPSHPVGREYEEELHSHYDRPLYWNPSASAGVMPPSPMPPVLADRDSEWGETAEPDEEPAAAAPGARGKREA